MLRDSKKVCDYSEILERPQVKINFRLFVTLSEFTGNECAALGKSIQSHPNENIIVFQVCLSRKFVI